MVCNILTNKVNLLSGFLAAASGALALAGAIGGWGPTTDAVAGVSGYISLFAVCTNTNGAVNCIMSNLSQTAVAGGVLLLIGSFFGFLDLITVLLKTLMGCCATKRDAHARFFLVLLSFVAIFCGTVVAGGGSLNGKTYVEALKAQVNSSNPLGGGFGCAIAATIVSFFALLLSLVADCLEKKPAEAPALPK